MHIPHGRQALKKEFTAMNNKHGGQKVKSESSLVTQSKFWNY